MWIDTGINLHGYASDFGSTWVIGREPDDGRTRSVRAVAGHRRPGAGPRESRRDGRRPRRGREPRRWHRPWLSYFYLAHGIGTDSAEMPFVGTDLGTSSTLRSSCNPAWSSCSSPLCGTTGSAGHRSEEIVAVTDDGYVRLSAPAALDQGGAA